MLHGAIMKNIITRFLDLNLNKRAAYISIGCLVYVFLFATPPFTTLLHPQRNSYWPYIYQQMLHPFTKLQLQDYSSHVGKLSFRLIVPLIGFLVPFKSMAIKFLVVVIIKTILGYFFFYKIYIHFSNKNNSKLMPFLFTTMFLPIFVGKSFVTDFMWFDAIAFYFIFIAMICSSSVIVFLSCLLACFTDEKAYFSLLIVFVYRIYYCANENRSTLKEIARTAFVNINVVIIPLGLFAAIIIRVLLDKIFGIGVSVNDSKIIFLDYLRNGVIDYMVIGIYAAFKSYWTLIIGLLIYFYLENKLVFILTLFSFIPILLASISVWDLTRSLNYGFPILFFAISILNDKYTQNLSELFNTKLKYAFITIIICSFITPAIMVSDAIDINHNILIKIRDTRIKR